MTSDDLARLGPLSASASAIASPNEPPDADVADRKRERQRSWYRKKYAANPEWAQAERERKLEYKRARLDAGRCANCGGPLLSDWYCWDCLTRKEDYSLLSF